MPVGKATKPEGFVLKEMHQFLVYATDINLLGEDLNVTQRNIKFYMTLIRRWTWT
jgi:hypothetical protein